MGTFIFQIVEGLLSLFIFLILANAVMSWLLALDVINYRNRLVAQIATTLDRICWPFLAPFRKIIPPLGGIDISPVIALIILGAAQRALVPWLFQMLPSALG